MMQEIPLRKLKTARLKQYRRHVEDNTQRAVIRYLRLNKIFCFAVPNGGARSITEGRNLKISGVLAGVSDLIVLLPNRAVFVEMKTDTGRQSEVQRAFESKVKELGFEYYVWRSVDDAINFVKNFKQKTVCQSPKK